MRVQWGWVLVLLAACAAVLVAPARASASPSTGIALGPTTTVTVGDTGIPETVLLTNTSTAPDTVTTVCRDDDPEPCQSAGRGMRLIPQCGDQTPSGACTGPDAGVFGVNAGTGVVGTVCAGLTFDVVPSVFLFDPLFGIQRFVPHDAHIPFGGAGSTCRIAFTVDVLRQPTRDRLPAVDGLQTVQLFSLSVRSSTTNIVADDVGVSPPITVLPAPNPETTITSGPADGAVTSDATPTFEFSSSRPSSTFGCSLDGSSPFACSSPYTSVPLGPGAHAFSVAASAAGATDPTPATRSFVVRLPDGAPATPPAKVSITSTSTRVSARGAMRLGLRCTAGAGPCAGKVTVTRSVIVRCPVRRVCHRTLVLARTSFSIPATRSRLVPLVLGARGRALLSAAPRHRLAVSVAAAGGANRAVRLVTLVR